MRNELIPDRPHSYTRRPATLPMLFGMPSEELYGLPLYKPSATPGAPRLQQVCAVQCHSIRNMQARPSSAKWPPPRSADVPHQAPSAHADGRLDCLGLSRFARPSAACVLHLACFIVWASSSGGGSQVPHQDPSVPTWHNSSELCMA